jgi:hypothetical protein
MADKSGFGEAESRTEKGLPDKITPFMLDVNSGILFQG